MPTYWRGGASEPQEFRDEWGELGGESEGGDDSHTCQDDLDDDEARRLARRLTCKNPANYWRQIMILGLYLKATTLRGRGIFWNGCWKNCLLILLIVLPIV